MFARNFAFELGFGEGCEMRDLGKCYDRGPTAEATGAWIKANPGYVRLP